MNKISRKDTDALTHLAKQEDKDINTGDIPESPNWHIAERGRFYRPVKKQVTLRIDEEVLVWFKSGGDKYQTRINSALREYIDQHQS